MITKKKGISLIVLVITIIVMIILAAAIILSISGSDIRGKANEAVSSSDIASAKEFVAVARSEWEMNYDELSSKYEHFGKYATEKIQKTEMKNVIVSKDGAVNIIYEDKNGDTAIIPEGFSVSEKKGEQTIDDGLVIVDEVGNEFVWVPVNDYENRFKRTIKYKPTENITDPGSDYLEPYKASNDPTGELAEEAEMRASVKENKGFYIARYEAGLPEGKTPTTVTLTDKPISKKGATVWNKITKVTSMTEIGTEGAVYRARQMYKISKSVVSTLCYGVQWDSALQFIAIKYPDYPKNSTEKGNYTGSLLTTGYSEDYAVNNIYDMAGNVWEWTMEVRASNVCVVRGGSYSDYPAYLRGDAAPVTVDASRGFRVTLYIK